MANAIYDGTSAVMLSAETSAGKHPVEAVRMMARIACETEIRIATQRFSGRLAARRANEIPEIIADAAYQSARSAGVTALAVGTTSGASARLLGRYRPPVPVYAFTNDENSRVSFPLSMAWNQFFSPASWNPRTRCFSKWRRCWLKRAVSSPAISIVFVAGQPVGLMGSTNMLKLHRSAVSAHT